MLFKQTGLSRVLRNILFDPTFNFGIDINKAQTGSYAGVNVEYAYLYFHGFGIGILKFESNLVKRAYRERIYPIEIHSPNTDI